MKTCVNFYIMVSRKETIPMKLKNIVLCLSPLMMLASCSGETDGLSKCHLYLRTTFSGGYVQHISKSKEDKTEVSYMTVLPLGMDEGVSEDALPSDFTVADGGKTFTGVCFVTSMNFSSITVNGVKQTVFYIVETKTDKVTFNKDYKENLSIEFDTLLSDDAVLSFKKTEIKDKLS